MDQKVVSKEHHQQVMQADIFNLYHCNADNIGDLMCGPGQYIWPDLVKDMPLSAAKIPLQNVIIGGGQIFSQLGHVILSIYELNPSAKVVAWGVGIPPAGKHDALVSEVADNFSLFGTRNYDRKDQFSFVPCASCLAPAFDNIPPPKHELVFYLHRKKGGPIDIPLDAPTMTNSMRSPQEVIDFIASGETVVTSSYHGVYWAQLLGRKVICIPYNNKFETFQYRPTIAESGDWRSVLPSVERLDSPLDEYRQLNKNFSLKVMDIWNA